MRVTRKQLRRIIQEEARRLNEQESPDLPTKEELEAFGQDMEKQIRDMYFRITLATHSEIQESPSGTRYSEDQFDRGRAEDVKLYMNKYAPEGRSDTGPQLNLIQYIANRLK